MGFVVDLIDDTGCSDAVGGESKYSVEKTGHHRHTGADDGEMYFCDSPESDWEVVPGGIADLGDVLDEKVELGDADCCCCEANLRQSLEELLISPY